jgi:predicted acylesterase/phospholipase RssA
MIARQAAAAAADVRRPLAAAAAPTPTLAARPRALRRHNTAAPRPHAAANQAAPSAASSPHPYAFSFSAGGLLFPYHWGVATELARQGALDRAATPLAGASAGSIIVACLRSGLSDERVTDACLSLAADCRSGGTRTRLGPVLEAMLQELLPEDVHERCNQGGSAHIAVTRLFPDAASASASSAATSSSPLASFDGGASNTTTNHNPARAAAAAVAARVVRPELLSHYQGRDDLIAAVLTSSHIPWYLDGKVSRRFRGGECLDGGLTQFIPVIPGTVVASSSSSGSESDSDDSDGEAAAAAMAAADQQQLPRMVRVTCFPSRAVDAAVQRAARVLGPEGSALRAGRSAEAAAAAAAERAVREGGGGLPPPTRFAEVSPDRFADWGVSMREAVAMAFEPAPDATLLALLEKGREDARAWLRAEAEARSVPAAAAAIERRR